MKLAVLSFLFLVCCSRAVQAQDFTPNCGDCWCIIDDGSGSCPNKTEGIYQVADIPSDLSVLTSFNQVNDAIVLEAPEGGPCTPFPEEVTSKSEYSSFTQGQEPQCEMTPSQTGNVCAYKFTGADGEPCSGRDYELLSYEDEAAAEADGALLVHRNEACGVCSNAQDVWARMDSIDAFEARSVTCAQDWLGSRNFENLIGCYTEMGFTEQCATLWAHYTASNTLICAPFCLPGSNNLVTLAGEPPECAYSDCVNCAEIDNPLNSVFDSLSGHTLVGASIVDRKPFPCSSYTPLTLDVCVGADPDAPAAPSDTVDESDEDGDESDASMPRPLPYYLAGFLVILAYYELY